MVSETRPMVLANGHNAWVVLDQSALLEVLDALKAAEVDYRIRQAAQTTCQALIEAELAAVIGTGPHERTPERLAQRNGHRPRLLTTTAGDLELRIPKLRAGSFFLAAGAAPPGRPGPVHVKRFARWTYSLAR
jgi:hypothetical protein